ncbi:hypothetical protein PCL_11618 [Purpureocillium lilacinum]|uniref:Uncharacterized protein n=1 Tax=Purpureocillium lilacinum TaxID=33203 RepID=A0A2U3EAI7_PURLI|nr:hypothetical protein PCL_11618 [Purpureocillium lilacinum]
MGVGTPPSQVHHPGGRSPRSVSAETRANWRRKERRIVAADTSVYLPVDETESGVGCEQGRNCAVDVSIDAPSYAGSKNGTRRHRSGDAQPDHRETGALSPRTAGWKWGTTDDLPIKLAGATSSTPSSPPFRRSRGLVPAPPRAGTEPSPASQWALSPKIHHPSPQQRRRSSCASTLQ